MTLFGKERVVCPVCKKSFKVVALLSFSTPLSDDAELFLSESKRKCQFCGHVDKKSNFVNISHTYENIDVEIPSGLRIEPMNIRKTRPDDKDLVEQMLKKCGWPSDAWERHSDNMFIGEKNGEAICAAAVHEFEPYFLIHSFCIHPDYLVEEDLEPVVAGQDWNAVKHRLVVKAEIRVYLCRFLEYLAFRLNHREVERVYIQSIICPAEFGIDAAAFSSYLDPVKMECDSRLSLITTYNENNSSRSVLQSNNEPMTAAECDPSWMIAKKNGNIPIVEVTEKPWNSWINLRSDNDLDIPIFLRPNSKIKPKSVNSDEKLDIPSFLRPDNGCKQQEEAAGKTDMNAEKHIKDKIQGLINSLHASSTEDMKKALNELAEHKGKAKCALPALIELLENRNSKYFDEVMLAIRRISPDSKEAIDAIIKVFRTDVHFTIFIDSFLSREWGNNLFRMFPLIIDMLLDEGTMIEEYKNNMGESEAIHYFDCFGHDLLKNIAAQHLKQMFYLKYNGWLKYDDIVAEYDEYMADTIPILEKALLSSDDEMKLGASYALGVIGKRAQCTILKLIELLRIANGDPKIEILKIIGIVGRNEEIAFDEIISCLRDSGDEFRILRETFLYMSRDNEKMLPLLVRHLDDDSKMVREPIIEAIRRFGPKSVPAIPLLIKAVAADNDISYLAVSALEAIGEAAAENLAALLLSDRKHVRIMAIVGLRNLKSKNDKIIRKVKVALEDKYAEVRFQAAYAMHCMGQPLENIASVMMEVIKSERYHWMAKESVKKSCSENAIMVLLEGMQSGNYNCRRDCLEMLIDKCMPENNSLLRFMEVNWGSDNKAINEKHLFYSKRIGILLEDMTYDGHRAIRIQAQKLLALLERKS